MKLDLSDGVTPTGELLDWFLGYYESLDEAGKERLWIRMDMDTYDPKESEPSVFKKRMEEQTAAMQEDLDPEGSNMKSILKQMDDEFDWDMMTPWWKKVLVRVGLSKC